MLLIPQTIWAVTPPPFEFTGPDVPKVQPGTVFPKLDEEQEEQLLERDFAILSKKLAGDRPLTIADASKFRAQAVHQANVIRKEGVPTAGPDTFQGTWGNIPFSIRSCMR